MAYHHFARTVGDKSKSSHIISIHIKMPSNVAFYSSVFNHKSPASANDYYSVFPMCSPKYQTEAVTKFRSQVVGSTARGV